MSGNNLLSRILGRDADEDEIGAYSAEEIGTRRSRRGEPEEGRQPRGFTSEVAAEMIDGLPSDVPRKSAIRIVRATLAAAGIEYSDLERSTRAQMSKLGSEIELARNRQKELRKKTEIFVRSLEEEIRKRREACDTLLDEEEKKVSRASASLEEVKRVRSFFDFPEAEGEENTGSAVQGTRVLESLDAAKTQVRRRTGPIADTDGPAESSPTYGASHGRSDER